MGRHSLWALGIVLFALLACKKEEAPKSEAPAVATPTETAPPPPPKEPERELPDFTGKYVTNYGVARCTQVKKNVNCLYAGQKGSVDCKVDDDDSLDCSWEEDGEGTGKARLRRQDNGDLKGTWGYNDSEKNGGAWFFKKKNE